jgi:hypothetical protein
VIQCECKSNGEGQAAADSRRNLETRAVACSGTVERTELIYIYIVVCVCGGGGGGYTHTHTHKIYFMM